MQRYRVAVNGEEFKVQLIEKSANSLRFTLDDEPYTVDLAPVFEERVIALTTTASDTAQGSAIAPVKASAKAGTITAPMPGIVVSFSVKEGDTVQRGQTV